MERGLIRVFPRRTRATPCDEGAFDHRFWPGLWDKCGEVHISVTFSADKGKAEELARIWAPVCGGNVKVGGPAYGDPGGEFRVGQYLRPGYVITSRGCPNRCWFCQAWRREGREVRELQIQDGYNVLDSNLLACSRQHVETVFEMLSRQKEKARFTGGLEAARLAPWHVEWLAKLKPKVMWFAYDTADDLEPLMSASRLLQDAGLMGAAHQACCYVLIGWRDDTIREAEQRLRRVVRLGFFPQAMLLDNGVHLPPAERRTWREFRWEWATKKMVGAKMKRIGQIEIRKVPDIIIAR